jgi:hypothetical protein
LPSPVFARSSKMGAGFHEWLNSEAQDWRITYLQTAIFGDLAGICKTRTPQQQTAAAEFGTFLLETAMGAYSGQESTERKQPWA